MKVVRTAAIVIGAVATIAAIATGNFGAAALIGKGVMGIAWSTIAVSAAITASLTSLAIKRPGPTVSGSPTQFKADPQAPIPYVMGRTFGAGYIVHREHFGPEIKKVDNPFQGFVIVWSGGGPIEEIESYTVDKVAVSFDSGGVAIGDYAGFMWLKTQLGACPEAAALTSPPYAMPDWGSSSKLSGYAAGLWVLKFDKEGKKFAAGVPENGAIMKGVKVYDPRLDSTYPGGSGACRALDESTYVYSENPWLHALTFALGRWQNGRRVLGVGMPVSGIDVPAFVEAANIADANDWAIGGTISSTDDKWNALKMMAQAGGGECIRMGAMLSCLVSAPRVSIGTVTSKDLIGRGSVVATQRRRDRINGVIPRIRSEEHGWEIVPLGVVRVPEYVTDDGGERTREIDYQLVQGKDHASELAAYDIVNAREFGPISLPLRTKFMGYKPGDCLTLDIPEMGLEDRTCIAINRSLDPQSAAVTLDFKSETGAKHDFALGRTGTAPPTPSLEVPEFPSEQTAPILLANTYAIKYDATGALDPTDQFVKLEVKNVPREASVVWHTSDSEAETPVLKVDQAGTGDIVLNIPVENQAAWLLPADFGDSEWVEIYVEYDGEVSNVVRIIRIDPTDKLSGDLTEPFGAVLVENDGTIYDWSYASGEIELFVGGQEVDYAAGARVFIESQTDMVMDLDDETFAYNPTAIDDEVNAAQTVFRAEFPGKAPIFLNYTLKKIPRGADGTFDFVTVNAVPNSVARDADGNAVNPTQRVGFTAHLWGDLDDATGTWTVKRRNANGTETTIDTFGSGPEDPAVGTDGVWSMNRADQAVNSQVLRLWTTAEDAVELLDDGVALVAYMTADDPSEDETEQTDFDDMTFPQDGLPGISFGLTNKAHNVPADASGAVLSYAGASGAFRVIRADGVDVSNKFTLSTKSGGDPQALTESYNNSANPRTFAVSGAGTSSGNFGHSGTDTATLTILATGTAEYTGVTLDEVFSLGKNKAGSTGEQVTELVAYRRATSTPSTPTGGSYNFSTLTLTPPSSWSATWPTGTDPVYTSRAVAAAAAGGTDSTLTWTAPVLTLQNGEEGDAGSSVDIIFKRSASQPTTPSASSGTPATWYSDVDSVPAGSNVMWASVGTKIPPATNWTWQEPVQIEGTEGDPGESALSVSASPASVSVPTTNGGTPIGSVPGFAITAYKGSTNVTNTSTGTSYSHSSSGLSSVSHSGNGVYTVGGFTDSAVTATGYVEVTITNGGVSQKIRVGYSKAPAGSDQAAATDTFTLLTSSTSYTEVASVDIPIPPTKTARVDASFAWRASTAGTNPTWIVDAKVTFENITDGDPPADFSGTTEQGEAEYITVDTSHNPGSIAISSTSGPTNSEGETKIFRMKLMVKKNTGSTGSGYTFQGTGRLTSALVG